MECVVRSRCPGAVPGQKRRLPELTGKFSRVHQREESVLPTRAVELRAAGESSQRRERDSLDELTPQELTSRAQLASVVAHRPGIAI